MSSFDHLSATNRLLVAAAGCSFELSRMKLKPPPSLFEITLPVGQHRENHPRISARDNQPNFVRRLTCLHEGKQRLGNDRMVSELNVDVLENQDRFRTR